MLVKHIYKQLVDEMSDNFELQENGGFLFGLGTRRSQISSQENNQLIQRQIRVVHIVHEAVPSRKAYMRVTTQLPQTASQCLGGSAAWLTSLDDQIL